MPTSCRVRRGTSESFSSPYAPLLNGTERLQGELDGARRAISPEPLPGNTTRHSATRPRSRTLASLFSEPGSPTRTRALSSVSSRSPPRNIDVGEGGGTVRRPKHGRVTGHLASRRSQLPLPNAGRPPSTAPSELAGHGSQVDILVPNESQPGLVDSALSHSLSTEQTENIHHEDDIVEHLEVIDAHVGTVSALSNAANSILIPPMSLYSRRPVIRLPHSQARSPRDLEKGAGEHMDDLDRHVEHVLSRRDKVRRTATGIWSFVKTPMGIITAFYGFCVVFWGAAIVLFLLNWIPTSSKDRQGFWVEVSSQVENALFTVTGVGLIPWRVLDTYRILHIWYYKWLTRKLRKKSHLPELYDEDDLPDPAYDPNYVHVLTDKQQRDLHHHQKEFAKSQTWYRPHGTETHRAFPIGTALLICMFIDGNSIFQIMLCGCMWSLNRFQRPAWTTGTLIPASFICGIISAILIWKGGQKTKRTKVVEERLRAALKVEHEMIPAAIVAIANHPPSNPQAVEVSNVPTQRETPSPSIDEKMVISEGAEAEPSRHATGSTENRPNISTSEYSQ